MDAPLDAKKKFIKLRSKGHTFDFISSKLSKSKPTLVDWSKELKEEIANAKALELELLYEEFFISKESKIKKLGGVYKKLFTEFDKRNLKDIPTDKLLDMLIKYHDLLKAEMIEPIFSSTKEVEDMKNENKILEKLN